MGCDRPCFHVNVLMNFQHALLSIKDGFVSVPNAFIQMLDLFSCYYAFVYPSWNVLCLEMLSVRWCMFPIRLDKVQ